VTSWPPGSSTETIRSLLNIPADMLQLTVVISFPFARLFTISSLIEHLKTLTVVITLIKVLCQAKKQNSLKKQ
jgi:hypothetical protein